ncbi:MAG TPA: peroxidase [Acidimicrobiaceae bacterium]|nr:peroxidase [Acidimicrobiaceae bacterium]
MGTPQPGIFAQGTRSHRHLEFVLHADRAPSAVLAALAPLRQPSVAAGGVNIVIGFSPALWRELAPTAAPAHLSEFPDLDGVPSTEHDLWVWLHGSGDDDLFDVARTVAAHLRPVASVASEVAGFVYHDSRDLTGFVDGTENPSVEEAFGVVVVPAGQPGAGGTFAITQRWVHDLDRFHLLPVTEQEGIIGRTKADDRELDDHLKPPTAHISRVVLHDAEGDEIEIYRRSVPYGTVNEHGLVFVAFSADPQRFTAMLERMFGVSGDGLRDRLTEFTQPVTGAYWFVPSLEALGDALG